MSGQPAVVAEVRVSSNHDKLVLVPRTSGELFRLLSGLRTAVPAGTAVRHSAEGVSLPPSAGALLLKPPEGMDLRWSAEAQQFVVNRERVQRAFPRVREAVTAVVRGGADAARECLKDVSGLETLDPHQLVNVAAMTVPGGFGLCVFDEQGAGKTVTLIFAFDTLVSRDEADLLLVIAPKSMVPEWPRDFARFKGDLYRAEVVAGSRKEKREVLRAGADVLITNFETALSMEEELRALLRSREGRAVIAIDESFYVKNLDAQRTRAIRRLREYCGRAFVLCGTPAPNAPQDLIQQFNIVDLGMTFDGVEVPDEREAAAPVVQNAIDSRGLYVRHLKSQVLPDLPSKAFHHLLLPLAGAQRRLYEGALRDLIVDLEKTDDTTFKRQLTNYLARRSALLQICSNPKGVAPEYSETPAKLLALDDLLEELVAGRGEKVVLWSFYTATIDALVQRYSRYSPVRYDGTVADVAERRESVRRFQEDDSTMLFVANPAAAGAGLTLHRSRYVIYESMSNQAAHYLQSLDRVHRRGQTREVEYMVLLCDQSLEVDEFQRLTRKERAAQDLLGDVVEPPVTRQSLLTEVTRAAELLGSKP